MYSVRDRSLRYLELNARDFDVPGPGTKNVLLSTWKIALITEMIRRPSRRFAPSTQQTCLPKPIEPRQLLALAGNQDNATQEPDPANHLLTILLCIFRVPRYYSLRSSLWEGYWSGASRNERKHGGILGSDPAFVFQ